MLYDPYIDVKRVTIAHEYTLSMSQRCDYSEGRRVYGLCFAISGEATYKFVTGERYNFQEGDIFFLPANIAYTAYSCGGFRHYSVNFTMTEPPNADILPHDRITVLRSSRPKHYAALLRELVELWEKKGAGYSMRAVGCVYGIMADFIGELGERVPKSRAEKRLLPAKEYIDKNYTEPISILMLSELCKMSETNFRREFLKAFGDTPIRYRDSLRIRYAKELLSSGFYGVGEISSMIGVDNVGYFCRFFKSRTGMTPGEYSRVYG